MIEVVSALIVRNGRAFLCQRANRGECAFCWETPGGKVEQGETWDQALRREIGEEIGVKINLVPAKPLADSVVTFKDGSQVRVVTFFVWDFAGEPTGREGQGFGWFTPDEIKHLVLMPADTMAREKLVKAVEEEARGVKA